MMYPLRIAALVAAVPLLAFACASNPATTSPGGTDGGSSPGFDAGGAPLDAGKGLDAPVSALPDATATADAAPTTDARAPEDAAIDGAPDSAPNPATEQIHDRADEALAALMLNYWASLAANTTTYDWMFPHYWEAALDETQRRGSNAFTGTPLMFFNLQNERGWLDGYYDDEDWVTLALLHSYKVTGDATYLTQAETVFADIMNGWDTTCCGANPGGIWWDKAHGSKATASNAGPIISAARLYEYTNQASYLTFANQVFAYWSQNMVDTTTGHVYDNINSSGSINTTWSFTYNEGLFIGAIVELAQASGDTSNLPLAHTVAGYIMSNEIETTSLGTILSDGNCSGDGDMFKGVAARYLNELYQADTSHTEYRDFLERSADAAWTLARNPTTGDIACDWAGPDSDAGAVGALGSAAIGIAAAAEALGSGAQRPALLYEAEEGNLHSVGLEAKYAGFSGWGYLAGWGADGESVDLLVSVPASGQYALTWRYATGGDAVRTLSLNGAVVTQSMTFPSTGDYTSYGTVVSTVTLAAGSSTLNVAYTSTNGSTGYLNLDNVQLAPQ